MKLGLTGSSQAHKRRALDFYPTPPDVTHALMQFLGLKPCKVWEPACGTGDMSETLAEYGHSVLSTDLSFTGFGAGGIDFLEDRVYGMDAIITNPPFDLSEQFIRHALEQTEIVAMVLKAQYWHAKKRTQLFYEHRPAYILALNWRPDFLNGERGGSPTMEVIWTVWLKGQTDTRYRVLNKPVLMGDLI